MRTTITTLLLTVITVSISSDQVPAPPQTHPILLMNATIHPVSADEIRRGAILFEKGVITAIGRRITNLPDNTETIDLQGKHVYPGMIAAASVIGLTEIGAVAVTRDFAERGDVNPNVRAEVAYHPDSEIIPVTRSNGVLLAHSCPTGGLISGTSAVMMLDGWTWETATLKAQTGLHINWPNMGAISSRRFRRSEEEVAKRREEAMKKLDSTFEEAQRYLVAKEAANQSGRIELETDLRWEAMLPVLRREVPVFMHASEVRQIESAVEWANRHNLKMVIVGGYDAWRVADLLKKYEIPVIYETVNSLPRRRWEDFDTPFTGPLKLYEAGVKYCISMGTGGASNHRNTPYEASKAASYGLPKNEALKSVTLYAAEVLGIADKAGSLEKGKDATLMITDGDPLEITTQVEQVYIQGKKIDMSDRHKVLYDKYKEKYRQLGKIK
ncbi:MAG TPA: imidazolonepropionase [Candidatus Marinimicrobia bacterium]|jgi:imidazolonepropionase-like amidohydrolase|nr:imidazolonepropionase [Candidatus Neomarinimicrobiota bacterium]HHZ99377.1 imidazolonepropionase [Candidatus Neomarinimicrobiota bacterium]HIB02776.1 imidazolonepropionase [Candidatus Neomarinimicrobiota bacterium]HIB70400.1 imidazolonepropionase [Candidatus Neomarinimicrobiota bacterium]HIB96667.1 imidazolonepropionase [Candidatus Neomarinimicrobiota bacterium]